MPLGSESEYPRVATAVVDSAARMFISGTDDGMVWERDPVTGKRIGVPMPGISFDVLVRSDGGAVFATGSRDGDIAQYA